MRFVWTHSLGQRNAALAQLVQLCLPLLSAFDWRMLNHLGVGNRQLLQPRDDLGIRNGRHDGLKGCSGFVLGETRAERFGLGT